MHIVHFQKSDLPSLADIPDRPKERSIVMVEPSFFDILYEINPHMKGHIGTVNKEKAMQQWQEIRNLYQRLGYVVHTIQGVEGLPDMVFCANQSFPFLDQEGKPAVLLSNMASKYREPEVGYIEAWYKEQGYRRIHQAKPFVKFEGMGDAIWHPNKRLAYIGYGFRTDKDALQRIATGLDFAVVGLELIAPHFYHLDTALSVIDTDTALFVKEAFSDEGIAILQTMFSRLIQVPLEEAKRGFVTNGLCLDGKHFVVQKGNHQTKTMLEELGIQVWEVDTSEFMKSGGSVFCMKMMLP